MNFRRIGVGILGQKRKNQSLPLMVLGKINFQFISFSLKNRTPSKRGFSLLEMVTSLFLISILLAMASISFLHLSPKYKLKRAVWEINSSMNYARYKAVFSGSKTRICFGIHSYWVEKYDPVKNQWKKSPPNILEGVVIQANNTPTFHPQGTVSHLASIIISNSWGKYKISLAISGRIKTVSL